jgi:ATP-dependent Lon protease
MAPESTVVRNYLDWLLSIPWNKKSKINKDIVHAQHRGPPNLVLLDDVANHIGGALLAFGASGHCYLSG